MEENPNPAPQSARILIVDDSKTVIAVLNSILSPKGYQLFTFLSPTEALRELSIIQPDVVITDLEMPEIHGLELISRIRKMPEFLTVPILAITGQVDTDAMAHAISNGADAFISKEHLKYAIYPQVLALSRLRNTYLDATRGKQLEAVTALVGTYKHEFGNLITIFEGKFRKLCRTFPGSEKDPSAESVLNALERMKETLQKLNKLQSYQETNYATKGKILKVS